MRTTDQLVLIQSSRQKFEYVHFHFPNIYTHCKTLQALFLRFPQSAQKSKRKRSRNRSKVTIHPTLSHIAAFFSDSKVSKIVAEGNYKERNNEKRGKPQVSHRRRRSRQMLFQDHARVMVLSLLSVLASGILVPLLSAAPTKSSSIRTNFPFPSLPGPPDFLENQPCLTWPQVRIPATTNKVTPRVIPTLKATTRDVDGCDCTGWVTGPGEPTSETSEPLLPVLPPLFPLLPPEEGVAVPHGFPLGNGVEGQRSRGILGPAAETWAVVWQVSGEFARTCSPRAMLRNQREVRPGLYDG